MNIYRTVRVALLAAVMAAASIGSNFAGPWQKVDDWVVGRLAQSDRVPVLVRFDTSASLHSLEAEAARTAGAKGVHRALVARARARQQAVRKLLDSLSVSYRPFYIVNALRVKADRALLDVLAARPEVTRIVGDPAVYGLGAFAEDDPSPDNTEWGIRAIRADRVWSEFGVHGEGFVVASEDTGVEWDHPALRDHYRGWDGSGASHDYNWHDAIEDRAVPLDDHDHGTHTTGTMVGDDGAGNQIGVAPGAKWIACRNMDHGVGRPSTYLECMEFFLAPWPHGGDPELDGDSSRAPDVINNSWGCPPSEGCDPETLHDGVAALNAAGILFVASAGNSGPFCSTVSDPPAIYPESFSVGATDSSGALALYSSKGPVTVDGSGRLKPEVSAPGSNVRSSVRGGGYASFSGTSMAGPHVAGATALLWSARPGLRRDRELTLCLLERSAIPVSVLYARSCGGISPQDRPNNHFGWGQIDVYGALTLAPDADGDAIGDACDCAPDEAGAFAPPQEVRDLRFESESTLRWESQSDSAGPGTTYDVLRGDLATLRVDGNISGADLPASGLTSPSWDDPETPLPDAGFYYLVQSVNSCGGGGWGSDSSGSPRLH